MPVCPRCQQFVESQAIVCPTCRLMLKAHGHPGIPLFRAEEDEYLCQTCTYHEDDTCNFPQRPFAKECTLYHNPQTSAQWLTYKPSRQALVQGWLRRNTPLLIVAALLLISLLIALGR
jgi:C4-type Zn-finger protein